MMTYFWYILGDTINMISASDTYSNMIKLPTIYVWIYYPGMSNMITYQPPCASTAAVINTESVETVGEDALYFFIVSRFFLP